MRRDAPGGGGGEERQEADDGGGGDRERVGKGIQKEEGTGPCDSDHPPCDFKYVHRLHASAVPRDVPFGFLIPRAKPPNPPNPYAAHVLSHDFFLKFGSIYFVEPYLTISYEVVVDRNYTNKRKVQ